VLKYVIFPFLGLLFDDRYDHLVDMVHRILPQQPPDIEDKLELLGGEAGVVPPQLRPPQPHLPGPLRLAIMRSFDEMFRVC
jgi:hypothetical protein